MISVYKYKEKGRTWELNRYPIVSPLIFPNQVGTRLNQVISESQAEKYCPLAPLAAQAPLVFVILAQHTSSALYPVADYYYKDPAI
jgi:hypothetical protein